MVYVARSRMSVPYVFAPFHSGAALPYNIFVSLCHCLPFPFFRIYYVARSSGEKVCARVCVCVWAMCFCLVLTSAHCCGIFISVLSRKRSRIQKARAVDALMFRKQFRTAAAVSDDQYGFEWVCMCVVEATSSRMHFK